MNPLNPKEVKLPKNKAALLVMLEANRGQAYYEGRQIEKLSKAFDSGVVHQRNSEQGNYSQGKAEVLKAIATVADSNAKLTYAVSKLVEHMK